jgi:hypothetical protein
VGRLDDIIDRNKHPRKHSKQRFPVGIMLSGFVLLILILMIFTDLGMTPAPTQTAPATSSEKRVDGVLLYRDKKPARADAGGTAGSDQPR